MATISGSGSRPSNDEVLQDLVDRIGDLMEASNDQNDQQIQAIVGEQIVPYMVSQEMYDLVVKFPSGGHMMLAIRDNRAKMDLLIPRKTRGNN